MNAWPRPTGAELQAYAAKPDASDRIRILAAVEANDWMETEPFAGAGTQTFVKGERILHVKFDGNGRIFWLATDEGAILRHRRITAIEILEG